MKELVKKLDDLTSLINNDPTITYESISLKLLNIMEGYDIVKMCDDGYTFNLKSPTCQKYEFSHLYGALVARNMLLNLITALEEKKFTVELDEDVSVFTRSFNDLIYATFPFGDNCNESCMVHQISDFSLTTLFKSDHYGVRVNKDFILLQEAKNYRKFLIEEMISVLLHLGYNRIAFDIFRKNRERYSITFKHYSINIRSLEVDDFSYENLILLYSLLITEYNNASDTPHLNDENRRKRLLQYKKYILLFVNELDNGQKNKLSPHLKRLTEAKTTDELEEIVIFFSNLTRELLSLLDSYDTTEKQRYYLSILSREYSDILAHGDKLEADRKSQWDYKHWLSTLEIKIEEKLREKKEAEENELIEKASAEMLTVSQDEKADFAKAYFDSGKNYINYCKNPIKLDSDALYEKIKENDQLINVLAMSQKRLTTLIKYKSKLTTEDYIFLIAAPIKQVEVTLKKAIILNLKNEKIYSLYDFRCSYPMPNFSNKQSYIIGSKPDDMKELTETLKLTAATAGHIVYLYYTKCAESGWNVQSSIFTKNSQENKSFYNSWINEIRNGSFHSRYVDTIDEALEIYEQTAYCLAKIIEELKPIK